MTKNMFWNKRNNTNIWGFPDCRVNYFNALTFTQSKNLRIPVQNYLNLMFFKISEFLSSKTVKVSLSNSFKYNY